MRAFVNAKAVIIGMGFLMEYIFPCWKNAMGAKVSLVNSLPSFFSAAI